MSLDELYNQIKGSADMQAEFENAIDSGKLADFAKAHGVDSSEDEIAAYFSSK